MIGKEMNKIIVRKMIEKDIDEVLEIERKSFTTPWSKEAFIMEIKKNLLADYIVAEIDSKVVAYGGFWNVIDEAHITNIAVHPDHRGIGLGNIIVEKLISICEEKGIKRMTLEVRKSNYIAQSLYQKYGFEPQGIRPKYYSDTNEDAIIMWKEV